MIVGTLAREAQPVYLSLMYSFVLALHNIIRWVVLLIGIVALIRVYRGLFTKATWTPRDQASLSAYAISLSLQFLLGLLLLVWLSPITRTAFGDFGAAMRDPAQRFFVLEHPLTMILGVGCAHIARQRVSKATSDSARFKTAAILLTLSLLLILARMPWMRPMFPAF